MEIPSETTEDFGEAALFSSAAVDEGLLPRDATFADRVSILVDGVLDPDRDVAGPGITEPAVLAALERASA